MTIISGGQTGADRGGLDFALEHDIPHGGCCPNGRRSEDGQIPLKYRLTQLTSPSYSARTVKNVIQSNATAIFCAESTRQSPGTVKTVSFCVSNQKPYIVLCRFPDANADAAALVDWLLETRPRVLNVAGNRESVLPGLHLYTKKVFELAQSALVQRLGEDYSLKNFPPVKTEDA